MKELGLDGENAAELLQGYVTRRIETFLAGHGRSIIGWDEILSGDISSTATIMSWRGVDGGIAAAKAAAGKTAGKAVSVSADDFQDED
jgi:hexosaminidase